RFILHSFPTRRSSDLTPSTQLSVESGQMNALLFEFTFNEFRSDGQLELNYENLKLATFKDPASSEEREIDNFKTFMINTFVFRKDRKSTRLNSSHVKI